jgi:hypothetical protein
MESDVLVDLDLAAHEMDARRKAWTEHGFEVGPLTWRDVGQGWPWHLVSRDAATDPDSVGFRVRRGSAEGGVVLFRGGWADVEWWTGDSGSSESSAPDVPDVDSLSLLLDSLLAHWLATLGRATS